MSCGDRAIRGAKGLLGLTVKQLQQILKDSGEDYRGNRAELCERINKLRASSSKKTSPKKSDSPKKVTGKTPRRRRANVLIVDSIIPPKVKSPIVYAPKAKSPSPPKVKSPSVKIRSPKTPPSLVSSPSARIKTPKSSSPKSVRTVMRSSKSPSSSLSGSKSSRGSKGKEEESPILSEPEDPITEVTPAEENLEELRQLKIQREKDTNIFEALTQPFPKNYGLTENGYFDGDIMEFSKSTKIDIASYRLNFFHDEFIDLVGIQEKVFEDCVYQIRFNLKLYDELLDDDNSFYLTDLHNKTEELDTATVLVYDESWGSNLNDIKECIQGGGKILYLRMGFSVPEGSHASQIILNIGKKKGWYIDTLPSKKLYEIFRMSIEVFLQHYIDNDYILERYDFDSCPGRKIQGQYDTCDGWTHYIFTLSVLNPELTEFDIFRILSSYNQKTRDHIIIIFYYYFYNLSGTSKDKEIKEIMTYKTRNLPMLPNNSKLTFVRS